MPLIEKLTWDTNFFEINIGRCVIDDERNFDPIKFQEEAKHNYDLVYVFSYQNILSLNKASVANLDLVDIMVTMSMPFKEDRYSDKGFDFRTNLTKNEINGCYDIAEQTSMVSRFYNEPLIGPDKAKALYRKWVDNALNNSFSDGILLTKSDEIVTGLHIIKAVHSEKTGFCSLIGVDKNYKGTGIGKNLWEQALGYWALHADITKCKVPFSIKNTESFNFHLKIGFNKIEEIKYIYHYRNNTNTDK